MRKYGDNSEENGRQNRCLSFFFLNRGKQMKRKNLEKEEKGAIIIDRSFCQSNSLNKGEERLNG